MSGLARISLSASGQDANGKGRVMRPATLDFEASGFGVDSYPIEVGVALPDGRKYCSLIAPAPGWTHWDLRAQRLHGITPAILAAHGRPVATVARELNDFVGGGTVYSDGWVVDNPWFLRLFHAAALEPCFRLSALEMILDETQLASWDATKQAVLAELGAGRHRASFDAYVVQETWCRSRRPRAA